MPNFSIGVPNEELFDLVSRWSSERQSAANSSS
jgi:hypothetical protein